MDEREVEEADAVGESLGDPTLELDVVEGIDSAVTLRRTDRRCGRAVALMMAIGCGGETGAVKLNCEAQRKDGEEMPSLNPYRKRDVLLRTE